MHRPLSLALLLAAAPALAAAPRIVFQSHALANGLTVVTHEDHSMPVVAVNLWYKVGSKHEQPGRTGFAHLFEHYMFEGSKHSPAGEYFQRIFGMGGVTNANTTNDRTDYFAVVPSENLEEVLRLESDRMGFLRSSINAKNLEKQRDIVQNEKRKGENAAYGGAWDAVNGMVWPQGHPYKWGVIGSMADLEAASVQDVKDFHATYYLPNNAVLVLSGDFDTQDALAKVRKWFGPIPSGPAPPALNMPRVARPNGRKERTLEDAKAQVPLILMAYPIPGKGQPGWTELSAVAAVLGGGRSSRLAKSLQYDRRLAAQVSSGVAGLRENDLFLIEAIPLPGVTPEALVAEIEAEVAKVARQGIENRELNRVKAGLRTSRLNALQNAEGIAEALAEGQGSFGDAGALQKQMEEVLHLKPKQAAEAAGRWLTPDNNSVLTITPKQGAAQ
nr:insulinase family protein [Elusimicrobiota bacterium]